MCDLIEYSDNYRKILANVCQYYKVDPITNDSGVIVDFNNNGDSNLFH